MRSASYVTSVLLIAISLGALLGTLGPAQVWAAPATGAAIQAAAESITTDVQARTTCPRGYYFGQDGRCRRLHRSPECSRGYFLDYDGRCKRARKNLRLLE